MAHIPHDELFVLANATEKTLAVHRKPLRDVVQNAGYCQWMEAHSDTYGANRRLQTYLWAYPPAWRGRFATLPASTKAPVYIVLDTETTSAFDNKRDGTGLPRGGPRELAADPAIALRVHLLDLAYQVVDPLTYTVKETFQTLVQPVGTFEYVYDQQLYQTALELGIPQKDALTTLMNTVRKWRETHQPYFVAHNAAFDRKVIAYSLARSEMDREYFEVLATPWLCTMRAAFDEDDGSYHTWARERFPDAYAVRSNPKPPKLERLHAFCTGRDIVQTHRALDDVHMLVQCLPDLQRRGWFPLPTPLSTLADPNEGRPPSPFTPPILVGQVAPGYPTSPLDARPRPTKTTTPSSGRASKKPLPASKPILSSLPTCRYALRSRGPVNVVW